MSYDDNEDDFFVSLGFILTLSCLVVLLSTGFMFKVWNERQMTHAYDRQAEALERIASTVESFK